ncbi:Iron-sulfur cluster insertion protein ErpA [Candidatus Hepatincola sp. Pdp]
MFNLTVTDSALTKIQEVLSNKPSDYFFRIEITSGGCAGFSTSFKIDNTIQKEDLIIKKHKVKIVINNTIANFIKDAELEYRSNIISSHFYLHIKTAKETCSCGSSFNI